MDVVCLCTRGLVHSRTAEAVDDNINQTGNFWAKVWSHDKPIPEAQNFVVDKALCLKPEFIWFVEEDVVPPHGTLNRLLAEDVEVVAAKYRLSGGSWCHGIANNKVVWAGLGCVLIRASVFKKLERPYFSIDYKFDLALTEKRKNSYKRRGPDIYFYWQLKQAGIAPVLVDVVCNHLRVDNYSPQRENGCHEIHEM